MKKHRLSDMSFDEISLVLSPDDPTAEVVISKAAPVKRATKGLGRKLTPSELKQRMDAAKISANNRRRKGRGSNYGRKRKKRLARASGDADVFTKRPKGLKEKDGVKWKNRPTPEKGTTRDRALRIAAVNRRNKSRRKVEDGGNEHDRKNLAHQRDKVGTSVGDRKHKAERDKRLREAGATKPRSSSKTQRQQAQDRMREAGATKPKGDKGKGGMTAAQRRFKMQQDHAAEEAGVPKKRKPGSKDARGNTRGLFGR